MEIYLKKNKVTLSTEREKVLLLCQTGVGQQIDFRSKFELICLNNVKNLKSWKSILPLSRVNTVALGFLSALGSNFL